MKTVKKLLLVNLIGLFITTISSTSQPGPKMSFQRQIDRVGTFKTQWFYGIEQIENQIPNLTEEQKTKIETFSNDFLKETKILKADLAIKKAELRKLELADEPDQLAINKKIEEIGELRTKLEKKRSDFHQKVRSILTNDQKNYFDAFCYKKRFKSMKQKNFRGIE